MNYLEAYKDQVVLVTGGAGAIGSNLTRALVQAGIELLFWTISPRPSDGTCPRCLACCSWKETC